MAYISLEYIRGKANASIDNTIRDCDITFERKMEGTKMIMKVDVRD